MLDAFYDCSETEILNIIKNEMQFVKINARKDLTYIKNSEGFYIILRNNYDEISCKYKKGKFVAVYRGHASKMRERIESHLFYNSDNTNLPNCMKVYVDEKRSVNINIETKKTYEKREESGCKFPSCKWMVAYVTLNKSKQGFREMFEKTFDRKYNKPEYSKR